MVSAQKLKFFGDRLDAIVRKKMNAIDRQFPEIKTDYQTLISQGKGKMVPESRIREIIGDLRHSCPLMVSVDSLFVFADEKIEAEKAAKTRYAQIDAAKSAIWTKEKKARDLVYFGKDAELMAALHDLEKE
jgi:hypothetical protein